MPRSSFRIVSLGVAVSFLTAAAIGIGALAGRGEAQEGPPADQAMPVPAITAEQKPTQIWKGFSGRLVAVDYVEIRPQVSGIIQKVNFEDGQIVKAGDVLFEIDPRPYEAAVASAKAELSAARENAQFTQKELKRAEELLKTGAISQAGYDERINAQKTNASSINAASARLKAAAVDLDHAAIKAPISGRIARPEITAGNLVAASAAPLLTSIVSDQEIYGDFEVDEQTYLTFVRAKAGQDVAAEQGVPVRMSLQGDKQEYQGKIKSFDNRINPTTGTIRVRAVFPNTDNALLPGMFANVEIGSSRQENVIAIPEKAVLTDQSRKFVYVAEGGAAAYREVKLGETIGTDRIVTSGLKPGDKVIIDNLMKIRPGAKVEAMSPQQLEAMKAQMAQQAQQQQPKPEGSDKKEDAKKSEQPSAQPADNKNASSSAKE